MASKIDENTQFVGSDGKPLLNGKLYIGTVALDPIANPITIYSDRALTATLANPQTLDADGRPASKIWIPGKYSIQVDDEDAVQRFQDLDAGEPAAGGITGLSNVQSADVITAEGIPAIDAYEDKELYVFQVASTNTISPTINIDGKGAKNCRRNFDQTIVKGQWVANQMVVLSYNLSQDIMEWVNHNNKVAYGNTEITIASAATVDLALATSNTVRITGNTGPITSFGTTPAGTRYWCRFTSSPQINHNATSLIIPGAANITIVAGDWILVESKGSGNVQIQVFRQTGRALVEHLPNNMQRFDSSGTFVQPEGVTEVLVTVVGSGGGGGGCKNGTASRGGGGGGGEIVLATYTISGNITVTINLGGTGGGPGDVDGNPGGTSVFGTLVANGGLGGEGADFVESPPGGLGGTGGADTGGSVIGRQPGGAGQIGSSNMGGPGGASGVPSIPGALGPNQADGNDGPANTGTGGSGAEESLSSASRTGGDGAKGYVIVRW